MCVYVCVCVCVCVCCAFYAGVTLSTALVNAGITSFEAVLNSNPRELEMVRGVQCSGSGCTVLREGTME